MDSLQECRWVVCPIYLSRLEFSSALKDTLPDSSLNSLRIADSRNRCGNTCIYPEPESRGCCSDRGRAEHFFGASSGSVAKGVDSWPDSSIRYRKQLGNHWGLIAVSIKRSLILCRLPASRLSGFAKLPVAFKSLLLNYLAS